MTVFILPLKANGSTWVRTIISFFVTSLLLSLTTAFILHLKANGNTWFRTIISLFVTSLSSSLSTGCVRVQICKHPLSKIGDHRITLILPHLYVFGYSIEKFTWVQKQKYSHGFKNNLVTVNNCVQLQPTLRQGTRATRTRADSHRSACFSSKQRNSSRRLWASKSQQESTSRLLASFSISTTVLHALATPRRFSTRRSLGVWISSKHKLVLTI